MHIIYIFMDMHSIAFNIRLSRRGNSPLAVPGSRCKEGKKLVRNSGHIVIKRKLIKILLSIASGSCPSSGNLQVLLIAQLMF